MAQFITDIFAQLDKKRALLCAGTKEKQGDIMAQFITDIFAQLDKKRALLCAGTKEKHDTMTVSWGGMLHNKSVFLLRSVILCLFVSFLFSVAANWPM